MSKSKEFFGRVMIDETPTFKVGDPCPDGYIARQEWAQVHMDAGLKQTECASCSRLKFPHELSERITVIEATKITRKPPYIQKVKIENRYCIECENKRLEAIKATEKE